MTMFLLHVDTDDKRVSWIRAGHDPALLYRITENRFHELKGPGLALGVDPDFLFVEQQGGELSGEQLFVIFTDGIWEACDRDNEPNGKERLKQSIAAHAHLDAADILEQILHDQQRHLSGVLNDDDVTLVVVKYSDQPA